MMTKDIQNAICKSEIAKGNIVSENFGYFFTGEMDVISINKSGYVSEFEVKISRSDFKADAKKYKWLFFGNRIEKRIPNYFYYVCPEGLIKTWEIQPYMGLIYFTENGLKVIQKAKLYHRYKHDLIQLLRKISTQNNWKFYYGACKLTLINNKKI